MTEDRRLLDEIAFLADQLAHVLNEQAPPRVAQAVARLRRGADPDRVLASMDDADLRGFARAMTMLLDLTNLAEDRQRVRVLRDRERRRGSRPLEGSIADAVASLRRGGSAEAVRAAVARLRVELVLTAHPTEAKRRTIRAKLRRVRAAMDKLDREDLLPREWREALRVLEAELTAWWHTDLVRPTPPTVQDELNRGLLVARELWHVTPSVYRELHDALTAAAGDEGNGAPLFLSFGSWIGGDRDGNPNVTAAVTGQTLLRLRREAVSLHLLAADAMLDTLSAATHGPNSSDIDTRRERIIQRWPEAAQELEGEHEHEGYRRFLVLIIWRLRRTLDAAQPGAAAVPGAYGHASELLDDLHAMRRALCGAGACAIAHDQLDDWIYRTQVFGLHLLALDVRQDARVHREVIEELLQKAGIVDGWASLPEPERIAALVRTLHDPLDIASLKLSPAVRESLATFDTIVRGTTDFGSRCIGGHVISMTQDASDVLAVLWMWTQSRRRLGVDAPPLPIMPLFETIEDLRRAATVLRELLAVPAYREHLAKLGTRQTIMVGYSDSTKDGGYLAACWGLYLAQGELHAVAQAAGVHLTFFHGRGGSLGRGGGPAARSIASLPEHTVDGAIRITEQGEVLAERYDDPQIAHRHLEQVVAATLVSGGSKRPDESGWAQHMTRLRDRAYVAYRALVQQDGFIDYFRTTTPIGEIERLQIGSRPARRRAGKTLADLRAIPWVFAWTQNRHIIPAWYGVGAALEPDVASPRELRALRTMYRKWAFFRATIDNAALALAKVDLAAAKRYAALADPPHGPEIWTLMEQEYDRTRRCLLAVLDVAELLDDTPWLRASIARRNPYIAPLNALQALLLRRIRETDNGENTELRDLARLTIHGIAAGMRTTG